MKYTTLSPGLQAMITPETSSGKLPEMSGEVSKFAQFALTNCNGGATLHAAKWLKNHVKNGGKVIVSIAGALSSFQIGRLLAPMIRQGLVHAISATAANHEESYYRLIANSHYAYIPRYSELTPLQEAELRDAGLRRITDTFLPEDESVRIMEPHLMEMWKAEHDSGGSSFPHEYFRKMFQNNLLKTDSTTSTDVCWAHAAYEKNIPIFIPGFEDSTMGNIFASHCHPTRGTGIKSSVMKTGIDYMHLCCEWYLETSTDSEIAFLQLGGGISADFPICCVPSLKHDYQIKDVRDWAGFIEIGSSPMSYGSYSGAGGKEKITWDKLSIESYYQIIQSDVTVVFPWIAAIMLDQES